MKFRYFIYGVFLKIFLSYFLFTEHKRQCCSPAKIPTAVYEQNLYQKICGEAYFHVKDNLVSCIYALGILNYIVRMGEYFIDNKDIM